MDRPLLPFVTCSFLFLSACYVGPASGASTVVATHTVVVAEPTPSQVAVVEVADEGECVVLEDPAPDTVAVPAPATQPPSSPCQPIQRSGCYWMENTSGDYCWVPAENVGVSTFDSCFAADSCSGGLGRSGGGCYKWADCSDCAAEPWAERAQAAHAQRSRDDGLRVLVF